MKLLRKVMDFFLRKRQNERVSLPLAALPEWLEKEQQKGILETGLEKEAQQYIQALKSKRRLLECKLEKWEKQLHSLTAEPQEEIYACFTETRELLEKFAFQEETQEEMVPFALLFNASIREKIDACIQNIEQSFFAEHWSLFGEGEEKGIVNPLLKELIEIQELRDQFEQKVIVSGVRKIEALRSRVSRLQQFTQMIQQLDEKIQNKQEQLDAVILKKEEKEKLLHKLREDQLYRSYQDYAANMQETTAALSETRDAIIFLFGKLGSALQDYSHSPAAVESELKELLLLYAQNPLQALAQDEGLHLLHVLEHLKALMLSGQSTYSLAAANVLVPLIEKAQQGYLQELQRQLVALQQEAKQLPQEFPDKGFMMKIQEIEYRRDHFLRKIELLQEAIDHDGEERDKYHQMRANEGVIFQNIMRVSLNKEVTITFT